MTPTDPTEVDIDEIDSPRCAHVPCACDAGETGFCSVHCETAGEGAAVGGAETCGCGHAACQEAGTAAAGIS